MNLFVIPLQSKTERKTESNQAMPEKTEKNSLAGPRKISGKPLPNNKLFVILQQIHKGGL